MNTAAIVTIYHTNYNFGGQLQAYALQRVVASYGIQCKVVDYYSRNKYKKMKALSVSTISSRFFHKLQMKVYLIFNPRMKAEFSKKKALFRQFMNDIPHTGEVNNDGIASVASAYDYWIVGSDQVWNPEGFTGSPLNLLRGVNGKKISYAASSLNAKYTPEQADVLRDSLDSFSDISVREIGLEKAIRQITGKPVYTVLDPTLLLNANEWDKFAVEPELKEKYAFVYLIHFSDEVRRNIYDYCKKVGLKMVIVPHAQGWFKSADEKYFDVQATAIGPAEWIGYIKNAEIVFTDSYHGTIFSVNFHKKFLSFEKLSGDAEKDSGLRKYSILSQLGLSDRCVPYSYCLDTAMLAEDIDYATTDFRLDELRRESIGFLSKALDISEIRTD